MANPIVKTPSDILTSLLRVVRAGLIKNVGIPNPQIDPGSDEYNRMLAVANELGVAAQNVIISSDAGFLDTATGTDLDRIVNSYGLTRRSASASAGVIFNNSSQSAGVSIPVGSKLISNFGLVYAVTVGGIYTNNQSIQIQSQDLGSATKLPGSAVLTWLNTPPFSQQTVLQTNPNVPGSVNNSISGGSDAEDDETLRARAFNLLQNPPVFGNWAALAKLAQDFEPNLIQVSFVYPAANGPATEHMALAGYANASSVSREISDLDMIVINTYIQGNIPEYTETVVTSVADNVMDMVLNLTIPFPIGASQLGTGGGWLDLTPFPQINAAGSAHDGTSNFAFCFASTVTNSNSFVIKCPASSQASADANIVGSRICWIDKQNSYKVVTATIQTCSRVGNLFTVTTDVPLSGVGTLTVNDYIFPAAANMQTYINNVLAQVALLGAGEKTNVSTLLPRALRKPLPSINWNNIVDSNVTRPVITGSAEVLDCNFNARRNGSGTEIGNATPPLPSLISDPPNIWIPQQIAFYPSR